jgi:hypothetical protein
MAYYDALVAKWATLSGTTAQKLAAINALTVAGPIVDVRVSAVVGYLGVNAKMSGLQSYAANAVAGQNGATTTSVIAARELVAIMNCPNAPAFQMSNPTIYAAMETMLEALVADSTSGITAGDQAALLALAATSIPWWSAPVAQGGGGLSGPISEADLEAAGGLS